MNDDTPPLKERRHLAWATLGAAGAALVLLVTTILPAEYGVDPTGVGRAFGFTKISEGEGPPPVDANASQGRLLYARDAQWALRERLLVNETRFHSASRTDETVPIPFDGVNLTRMVATLEWVDDDRIDGRPTLPDQFEIRIRGPQERSSQHVSGSNEPGGRGNLSAELPWRSTPFPRVENDTLLMPTATDVSANGTWTVTVRLYYAGGVAGDASAKDPGNEWRLRVFAHVYALEADGTLGDAATAFDRAKLTLQPGGAVEYKFGMEQGARMTYAWRSTLPITYDFHGDSPSRGGPDNPVTHARGISDAASGEFEAPFDGRHGWWWNNRNPEPVTITLETQGDYEILGVVG